MLTHRYANDYSVQLHFQIFKELNRINRFQSRILFANILDSNRNGGARRDRTDDLMLAKHALSQLSYGPIDEVKSGGSGGNRTCDPTLIKRVL